MNKKIKLLLRETSLILIVVLGLTGPFGVLRAPRTLAAAQDVGQPSVASAPTGPLLITEVLANADNESTGEVIEIKNISAAPVDLAQWLFVDSGDTRHTLRAYPNDLDIGTEDTVLPPQQLALVLDKDYTGEYDAQILKTDPLPHLATTNSGNLYLANGGDRVKITNNAGQISDDFSWTKDAGNLIPFARTINTGGVWSVLAPDPDGTSLGSVKVSAGGPAPSPPSGLMISELLPNPTGSDAEEFIELYNAGTQIIDLSGFNLQDLSGKKYDLSGQLAADNYLALKQKTTGIQLNNTSDELSLFFGGRLIDSTYYENAKESLSWSRFDKDFKWSLTDTPGKKNLLTAPKDVDTPAPKDQDAPATPGVPDITTLLKMDQDSRAQVSGIAATKKDLFFRNSFHLVDKTAGLIVTLPKDDQTEIKPGQKITLQGTLTVLSGMPRLIVDAPLKITGTGTIPIQTLDIKNLGVKKIGQLIKLRGQVISKSGKSFRITDQKTDKQEKNKGVLISIRKNTGITKKAPPKNQDVSVTGIALKSGEQIVLAPRAVTDIKTANLLPSGANFWPLLFLSLLFSLLVTALLSRHALYWDRSKNSADFCGQ